MRGLLKSAVWGLLYVGIMTDISVVVYRCMISILCVSFYKIESVYASHLENTRCNILKSIHAHIRTSHALCVLYSIIHKKVLI